MTPPAMQMQAKQLWQAVLGDMQPRLNRGQYETWLRPAAIVAFENDIATIATPNMFGASTLQARYGDQIEKILSDIVGRPVTATFVVASGGGGSELPAAPAADLGQPEPPTPLTGADKSKRSSRAPRGTATDAPGSTTGARVASVVASQEGDAAHQLVLTPTRAHGLNLRYVYATYVVGASNRFAHAASLAVAEHPGEQYNPFFIHGGVGLGKTHLLHSVGHRAIELQPKITVVYVSSEQFTNDLINAIRSQRMDEFRARYRTIDILMIDDIQFIAGKDSTQEEFFHTFNTLYQGGKQVILSSDRPPKAIAGLEDRLRSRFEGGLIADVQPPDFEMRIAILRMKAEEVGARLPDGVIEYIAHKDLSNIRELEGALTRLLAYGQISGKPLTVAVAMESLTDASANARRASLSSAQIVATVALSYGVPLEAILGRGRSQEVVTPRQVAMYLLREETGASLAEIGQELGGRDHTTALHGIDRIERQLADDPALRSRLMAIREMLFAAS